MIKHLKKKAFSMLEILIVLSIIGILLVIALPRIQRGRQVAMESAAKAELKSIQLAIELYYVSNEVYPSSLKALIDEQYVSDDARLDPWSRTYIYKANFQQSSSIGYELYSLGRDGLANSKDDVHAPKN